MELRYTQPVEKGVTTLMYVGDDDIVERVTQAPSSKELGIGAIAAIVALQSKGITRLAAIGIASLIGYRAYKAQK